MNPLESLRQSILNQLGSSDPPPDLGGSPKPRKRPRTSKYSRKELVAWAKLNGKPFGLNGKSKSLDILVIEDFILYKDLQDKSLIKDYKNKFELD